ncbi:hypothetical protein AB0L05_27635 [Nonomuraea pusilla]|uniref:hypothetical protein n=1 Tax=Nonomuraea pusilla TaxID=46177 RepID=UPI003324E82A
MDNQQTAVPIEAVLTAVAEQRNAALDDAAQLRVLAHQLMAERDQLAAELAQLRAAGEPSAMPPHPAPSDQDSVHSPF